MISVEDCQCALRLHRGAEWPYHITIVAAGAARIFPQSLPRNSEGVAFEKGQGFLEHGRNATRVKEVLHQILSRGLQVDDPRALPGGIIEFLQRRRDPAPPCDSNQGIDVVARPPARGRALYR